MKTIKDLFKVKSSVFDSNQRDTVHDIIEFKNKAIDAQEFFDETFITSGMQSLLTKAFSRLEGNNPTAESVFRLSQSMGGGKTHSMISLGILAQNPQLREHIMRPFYKPGKIGDIQVAVVSGRMRMDNCVWGEIAKQLGKLEAFKDFISPPSSPTFEDWTQLLQGQPTIILFDEMPPYFEAASGKSVGDTTLAGLTKIALANLVNAAASKHLEQCVIVFSDLANTAYKIGSVALEAIFDTEEEVNRYAKIIEPVQINTDEFYQVLRKRLFENDPDQNEVKNVVDNLRDCLDRAAKMGLTQHDPSTFAEAFLASYPFHPGIRDLYARFKENQGFQQTRALIRMMRIIVSYLWESKQADKMYLISGGDFVFTSEMLGELDKVNDKLKPAISADIEEKSGNSTAQMIDTHNKWNGNAQEVAKLVFLSSLSTATNAIIGLSANDIVYNLISPGRDERLIYNEIIKALEENCTFLHRSNEGRIYFKDTQNLIALISRVKSDTSPAVREKEIEAQLEKILKPSTPALTYQKLKIMPPLDQIKLTASETVMVVHKPVSDSGREIKKFYSAQTFKNRICFLSGQPQPYERVLDRAASIYACKKAKDKLIADQVQATDPQYAQADDLLDTYRSNFYQAVKDCFTQLYYPTDGELIDCPIMFSYSGNQFKGEDQIRKCLVDNYKFTEDISPDGEFRELAENELWLSNQPEEKWSEVRNRAAMIGSWTWHVPSALDDLKTEMVRRGQWKEYNGFVHKGPHDKEKTGLRYTEQRNDEAGDVTIHLTPVHGDIIHYMEEGDVFEDSPAVDGRSLTTKAMEISFLVTDSNGDHETGDVVLWSNDIILQYEILTRGGGLLCELRSIPDDAEIL
jgi:hypothetical protein